MSMFNPEKIFRGMMAGLGVSPEQVIAAINSIMAELAAIKQDREGFKIAAAAMVQRYDARLASIDAKLDRLLSARNGIAQHAPGDGIVTDADQRMIDHE